MPHLILEAVFRAFDRIGVRWCLLRVPYTPDAPTGDIDLLIDPSDVGHVRGVLKTLEFVQVPRWGDGLHFLSYHRPTDQWLWLHIVTELSFGPYQVLRTHAEAG